FTALAALHARDLDLRAHSEHGVLEGDFEVVADILAALRAGPAAAAATAEQIAESEEVAKDVAEIGKGVRIELRTGRALHAGVAEAIVHGAFLQIAQNAVGFAGLFELFFGGRVVGIAIGVIAFRQVAIGGLDFLVAAITADAQHLVVVSFGH